MEARDWRRGTNKVAELTEAAEELWSHCLDLEDGTLCLKMINLVAGIFSGVRIKVDETSDRPHDYLAVLQARFPALAAKIDSTDVEVNAGVVTIKGIVVTLNDLWSVDSSFSPQLDALAKIIELIGWIPTRAGHPQRFKEDVYRLIAMVKRVEEEVGHAEGQPPTPNIQAVA